MEEQECLASKITLQCWKHKERSCKHAESASDVKSVVDRPLSLCKLECGDQMPCKIPGHVCRKSCASRHAHTLCTIVVQDTFPSCGHPVKRQCYELLNNLRCDISVSYVFPDCNHVSSKKCHVNPSQLKCVEMVDYHFPGCNHPSSKKKKCSEKITWKCDKKEKFTKKDCGHELFRICQQKEEDVVCNVPCGRNRPGCGHPCTNLCGEDCSKGDCKLCERKQQETMKQFHKMAKKRIEAIEKKISIEEEKYFFCDEIFRDGAGSAEFQKVEDQVLKYIQPCHNWYPTVHKIEKVTNLKLEKRFEEAKSRAFGDNIDTKFHGTSDEGVAGITRDGFKLPDQNLPPGKRGMYGQGIYFATDSSKSAQGIYTKGSNKLLVCQVLLGRSMIVRKADRNMDKAKLRKGRYDSVYAPRGSDVMNDEFVIFDPAQALPQYIVHYSTTGLPPPQQLAAAGQPFIKKNMKPSRTVDPNDPFENFYNLAAQHYLSKCQTKKEIESIDVVINNQLLQKFEAKQKEFKSKGIPDGEILAYHGTRSVNIDSILRNNLDIKFAQRQAYGRGNYFSEFPEISMGYGDGLLLCRVLPGREWVDSSGRDILQGYNSKKVLQLQRGQPAANAFGDMVIIENSDQILPYFVMHFK
ncbi:uncharacterized protein LOC5506123 [Nematostella vectensis]|uniref:uncharacterized protein LOC5506123 n=1 Tax=Nematostella vectensis TaxID=45351 RepID=UPI0020779627|nr:uncharacterized protein LOC5506123 [Nematostella vectensis]